MASTRKRGLGKGLDALLSPFTGGDTEDQDEAEEFAGPAATLPVETVERGRYQARREFDPEALQGLADSIRAQGVLQPILVRPLGEGRYELLAGERRWRAAQMAGLTEIPALVRDVDERSAVAIGLIENIQRDDLNPLEQATGLQRLLSEFEFTHQQVAQAVGKSRVSVTNLLRLLDLNLDVKEYIDSRQLEMGHARALLGLKGPRQSEAARLVVSRGLSVRDTERLVRGLQAQEEHPKEAKPTETDPDVRRLQEDLIDRLGAQVWIQHGPKGKGKLVISYNSLDELDGILAHIR